MDLAGLIGQALEGLAAVTEGIQEDVQHEQFVAGPSLGPPRFGLKTVRRALVQRKEGKKVKAGGQEVTFRAIVSFLTPVPFDVRDRLTLSDGLTGPVVDEQGGAIDVATGLPYGRVVWVG